MIPDRPMQITKFSDLIEQETMSQLELLVMILVLKTQP